MAQCAYIANVSGTNVLAADPAASGACTNLVVLSADEYANWQNNPLNLSAEDGLTLSVAILGVWAVAWSIRALVRALDTDGEVTE